jgi:hypothetical protein
MTVFTSLRRALPACLLAVAAFGAYSAGEPGRPMSVHGRSEALIPQRASAEGSPMTAAQQQVHDLNAMMCKAAVDNLMSQALRADAPYHCDATHKAEFCRRLATPDGFAMVGPRPSAQIPGYGSGDLKEGAEFCGADAAAISTRVCESAERDEALDLLAKGCVQRGHARALVVRECAGRSFSSPPGEKYRRFCSEVAMADPALAGGGTRMRKVSSTAPLATPAPAAEPVAAAAADPRQEAIEKGKQLLRGLLSR